MNMLRYWLIFGAVVTTYGQRIQFFSSPAGGIHFPVTDQLILRCSLNNTAPLDNNLDITECTDRNVSFVASIAVTKNGIRIASVSQFAPANAFTNQNNLQVTGNVDGPTPEDCYLEMIWADPNQSQAGSYSCEINMLDDFYHNFVFIKSIEVHSFAFTMNQISDYILADREMIKELRDSLVQTQRVLQNVNSTLIQTQRRLQNMTSGLTQAQRRLQSMHTETGIQSCGQSSEWTLDEDSFKYKRMTINFVRAYDVVPKVTAGLASMGASSSHDNRLKILMINVTKTNFTVQCQTSGNAYLRGAWFDWISTD